MSNIFEKIAGLMAGERILEERESEFNGKITVVGSPFWGTHISVDGLTQSGGIIENIWRKPLSKIKNQKLKIKNCLILGLGGGTVAKLVRKYWPYCKITGVDIDSVIVEMGKKYLNLNRYEIEIEIEDAYSYVNQKSKIKYKKYRSKIKNLKTEEKERYDLILVDLYVGRNYPEKFESEVFLKLVLELLSPSGVTVFNRLYFGDKRPQAVKFGNRLEKVFSKVDWVYPEANLMFICSR